MGGQRTAPPLLAGLGGGRRTSKNHAHVFSLCLAGEAGGRAILKRESESVRTFPWGWRIGFLLCAGDATEAVLLRWTRVLSLESLKKVSSF